MAGKGGGAWKVAYADFVTAMMAFFMVMWLTSQKPEVKEAISEYFRNPSGRQIIGNPNSSLIPSKNDSSGGKRTRTRGKQPVYGQTKMTDEGRRSNIGTIIQFDENSVSLSQEAMDRLTEMLPELVGKPHKIDIRGHAATETGNAHTNQDDTLLLCYRRAMVAREFLVQKGIEPERMRLSQAGSSEPRFVGQAVDPASNARVEVYLLEEVYEAPATMMKRLVSAKSSTPPTQADLDEAMKGVGPPADSAADKSHH